MGPLAVLMARYAYDRLTALDHSFLLFEQPNAYMHVASTQIHEVGPLRTPGGGVDAEAIKNAVAALLSTPHILSPFH